MTTRDALVGTLPGVRLENDTHVCEITRFGAHVASWRVKRTSDELLFRSKLAKLDGTKAIRGGVPVCFPQFSDMGPCAQSHGFARTSVWAVEALSATEVTMVLRRGDEAGDGDAFGGDYEARFTATLDGDALRTALRVTNAGKSCFEFTSALHTYFRVSDCAKTKVRGLRGTTYLDNLRARASAKDDEDAVEFSGEVDRIYTDAPSVLTIDDEALGRRFRVAKTSTFPDAVVWNPALTDKTRGMSDFGDEEYREMVCVEVAGVKDKITVEPGETWEASQTISYSAI